MTDGWTDSNGGSLPSDWTPGGPPLAPPDDWATTCGCAPGGGPSRVENIIITGSPGAITSAPAPGGKSLWSLVLNDGTPAADFRIDRFDDAGVLADSPMSIVRATGVVSFNDPVMLDGDPLDPLEAATKQYVDAHAGIPDAPAINWYYGRFNGAWAVIPIQSDAPSDGQAYARQDNGWTLALTGGPYLPTAGGTITGNLTVNNVLTVMGSNSVVLNAAPGNQRAILGQTSGQTRWQLMLGDQVTEGVGNSGSNFSLTAYATLGGFIGTWLTIARADGTVTIPGHVNINSGLAVNGLMAVNAVGNLYVPGGNPGDVLATNGSAVLSWVPQSGGGGIADAPNDGTAYARKSAAWSHLTHTDITDWTATLGPYALITSVPVASTTTPLANGTAAVGTSAAYARADHVHPASPAYNSNRIINGDMRVNQRGAINGSTGGYTVDRWAHGATQATKITWSQTNGPPGFPYCLAGQSFGPYTALATDSFTFTQPIEADMVSDFAWGTANAQPVTLSFWANASITGTFSGAIYNYPQQATRSYPFTFSIPVAGVWTKYSITIPGDSGGTWVMAGNAAACGVAFDLGCGANFRAPAGAWVSGNFRGATGATSIVASNGGALMLTGVKLEVGSVATPFNRKSPQESLADCERYYQLLDKILVAPYSPASSAGLYAGSSFKTTMRATPTCTVGSQSNGNITGVAFIQATPGGTGLQFTVTTAGIGTVNINNSTLSAEL